jgi:hypothetical protein
MGSANSDPLGPAWLNEAYEITEAFDMTSI